MIADHDRDRQSRDFQNMIVSDRRSWFGKMIVSDRRSRKKVSSLTLVLCNMQLAPNCAFKPYSIEWIQFHFILEPVQKTH